MRANPEQTTCGRYFNNRTRLFAVLLCMLLVFGRFSNSRAEEEGSKRCLPSAHRGIRDRGADNSARSIEDAVAAQIPFIEVDVRRVVSGDLILFHDRHLREGNYVGPQELRGRSFESLSPRELFSIRLPDGSEFISLTKALEIAHRGDVTLMLDIKEEADSLSPTMQEVLSHHAEPHVVTQCQSLSCVELLKREYPAIPVLARLHSHSDLQKALTLHPQYVQVDSDWDLSRVRPEVERAGGKLVVKALGEGLDIPAEWRRLCAAGVSIVLTDHPREFSTEHGE